MTDLSYVPYTVEECLSGDFSRLKYVHNLDGDQIEQLKILRNDFFKQFQKAIEEAILSFPDSTYKRMEGE